MKWLSRLIPEKKVRVRNTFNAPIFGGTHTYLYHVQTSHWGLFWKHKGYVYAGTPDVALRLAMKALGQKTVEVSSG